MHKLNSFLYLSQKDLENLGLTTAEIVESLEHLIRGRARSQVWAAPKAAVAPPDGRFMMATLAATDDPPFLAVKSLVLNPRNPEHGLSAINSSITLLDSNTGIPVAVMDGNWVTAIRTAAASAVAAKHMAKSNASIIAFIGCGVQAHSHLRAFAELFPLTEIRAFGRGSANRDALCHSAEAIGLTAVASPSAQAALHDADIVITSIPLTVQVEPFLDGRWLKPGAFVSSTDLALPWIPEGMPAFDRIIIDDLEQESSMPEPMVKPSLVLGDISGLVMGKVCGRHGEKERTAFVFRAVALGDLALAALAYQRARANAVGLSIEM